MWRKLVGFMRLDSSLKPRPRPEGSPLAEQAFTPNPGNLRMFSHVPPGLKPGAALVVILHGCGQTAQGYDLGTGWSELARAYGFALLAPEQKAVNNPNTCFNWFLPEDAGRGQGEAASIAAMIDTMVAQHGLDGARVFITGLSAGGAMAAALLAAYPEKFAAGAIIAGLPFGAAQNVRDALETMKSAPLRTPRQWGDAVRAAAGHDGPWPRVSIWHGAADMTVNINNAQALAAQWADLHGLSLLTARQETADGAIRLSWDDTLEVVTVAALGHGTPIRADDLGTPGPFILDVGISSTRRIAHFFALEPRAAAARPRPVPVVEPPPSEPSALPEIERVLAPQEATPEEARAENMILRALRGLWRRH